MKLPKNMSDSLVRRLNEACNIFSACCDLSCEKIGWCEACWISVGGGSDLNKEEKKV